MLDVLSQFELANPSRLAGLLILPVIVYIAYRYSVFGARWQRTAALTCRLALVSLLVVALAGPRLKGESHQRLVVFAVDGSASISEAAQEKAKSFVEQARRAAGSHETVVLNFGAQPPTAATPIDSAPDRLGSDPAAAVLAAAALLPGDAVPDVVLLSDGRQTSGDLLSAAERAGVPISVVPLAAFGDEEVGVARVSAPYAARPGEPFDVTVVVESTGVNSGQVELYRGSERIVSLPLSVTAGETSATLSGTIGRERSAVLEARLVGFQDKLAENNRGATVIYPAPPTRLLVVQNEARGLNLTTALGRYGIEVTTQPAADLATTVAKLEPYDAILLSGVAPASLTAEQAAALKGYVSELGGGLIVAGQAGTFGIQAYQASALESLLPVAALARPEERKSNMALLLIIDRSASMLEDNRLGLAKEAAKQAVQLLTPSDKAGILAFGSDSQWISEIYPCSDKPELLRRIDTLQAEGQTNMYPALVKAFLAMEQADADRRHVILLTDGTPSPGDFQQIASRMASAGITVSTVSISKGAEQTILKDISKAAQGRHYHCDDPADVPKILVSETKSAAAAPTTEFLPLVLRQLPGLDISSAPPLADAVAVSPKPRAELLLIGAEGDPLLAWWRYGVGVSVAFTADVYERWSAWPEQGRFWARLVEHAARDATRREFSFELTRQGSSGFATLEALTPADTFLNGGRAVLELKFPGENGGPLDMPQIAPGRYQVKFDASELGTYEATAVLFDPAESSRELFRATRGLVKSYPDELRAGPADEGLLRAVADASGGMFDPTPEALFASGERTTYRTTPLTMYFVLVAALLLVADVAVRRYHEVIGGLPAATPRSPTLRDHVGGVHEAA